MKQYFIEDELRKQFKTHSLITGILFLIAGSSAIFLPEMTSITASLFVGWSFSSLWLVGLFFGVSLIVNGTAMLLASMLVNNHFKF